MQALVYVEFARSRCKWQPSVGALSFRDCKNSGRAFIMALPPAPLLNFCVHEAFIMGLPFQGCNLPDSWRINSLALLSNSESGSTSCAVSILATGDSATPTDASNSSGSIPMLAQVVA